MFWQVEAGKTTPVKEITPPQIPEDLSTAIKSGKVRAPTHIISTISDDRGRVGFAYFLSMFFFLPYSQRINSVPT